MEEKEMSFVDHLEELRWHVVRAVVAIFAFAIVAFISKSFVFDTVIFGPTKPDFHTFRWLCLAGEYLNYAGLCIEPTQVDLQSRTMTGQFTMHMTTSFAVGIIIAFPYIFWEFWRFLSPGLHSTEKKVSRGAVFIVSLLFGIGVSFGYFIMAPMAVNFLANYQVSELVVNEFDITSYVSTLLTLVLGSGILFQLPMVVYFLSKVGVVTPALMKNYRRHAIVVILLLGAMLTPPDPLSQIMIAIPLFGLYEVSIWISQMVYNKKVKTQEIKTY